MTIYFLFASTGALSIKVTTGELYITSKWQLDADGEWLGIRPTKKFLNGSEYPMNDDRLIVINLAHIVWIAEARS